ncbi:Crp/Fnr family transcriptional regulator [Planococcus salinus]|nr:Crp/Fnr family transcriptional regulator [Planococcus salinus]
MLRELSPWLDNTDCDWSSVYQYGVEKTIDVNETIYSVGQQASDVYIIKEGRVRLFHTSSDGREKALLIMCGGTVIGDSNLHGNYFENAITASKTTYIKMEASLFASIVSGKEDFLPQYTAFLNRKAQTLAILNLLGAYYDSETRIRYTMFHLANQFGQPSEEGAVKILMQFTQQELADLIGTSRVTVANMINSFVHQGLIEKEGRSYIIPSVENLLPVE